MFPERIAGDDKRPVESSFSRVPAGTDWPAVRSRRSARPRCARSARARQSARQRSEARARCQATGILNARNASSEIRHARPVRSMKPWASATSSGRSRSGGTSRWMTRSRRAGPPENACCAIQLEQFRLAAETTRTSTRVRRVGADGLDLAVFEKSQQQRLHSKAHRRLRRERGCSTALAGSSAIGAGEAALHMTEQTDSSSDSVRWAQLTANNACASRRECSWMCCVIQILPTRL